MNDELMFDYLLQMGAMQPEQIEAMRKQKQIDALRGQSMEGPQGQMIGKHYVPPSITQYAAQLGQGVMAGQAQKGQDASMKTMNAQQKMMLEELRRKRNPGMGPSAMYQDRILPIGDGPAY